MGDVCLVPVLFDVKLIDPMAFLPPAARKAVREEVGGVDETPEVARVMMVAVKPVPATGLGSLSAGVAVRRSNTTAAGAVRRRRAMISVRRDIGLDA